MNESQQIGAAGAAKNQLASVLSPVEVANKIIFEAQPPERAPNAVGLFDENGKAKAASTVLTEIGCTHHLFHDEKNDAFARVKVGSHYEVFKVVSSDYQDMLRRAYYLLSRKGVSKNHINDATETLKATAQFEGPREAVHLRVGDDAKGIVLDTGAVDWSIIRVTAKDWHVEKTHQVNFRRLKNAAALPMPTSPDFGLLWKYVNVDPADRVLVAAWLLAALRPDGPFPILLLLGEQGTGKSNSSRTLKALSDPSDVPLRAPPRDDQDLLIAALNSWVLVLDNLSGADPALSDALCRLSTGGALAGRKLYTNDEEVAHNLKRPVILNGIDDLASRPDLAERCIHLVLPTLAVRATEREMAEQFKADAPKIMAALLDALVLALRDVGSVDIGPLPRMADFAKWAAAGVPALGFTSQAFIDAYRCNQAEAIAMGLEASEMAKALRLFAQSEGRWSGSADELLKRLKAQPDIDPYARSWPTSAKGLQTALRRLAPSLRSVGITAEPKRTATKRFIEVSFRTNEAPL